MKNILVTGGTVFVSRYVAEYYVDKGYQVYTLNRNKRTQPKGANLIQADRHNLGEKLRGYHFDVVFDITAYTAADVNLLLDALGSYDAYILISSSAVYPESCTQPFTEETPLGWNKIWGKYGAYSSRRRAVAFAQKGIARSLISSRAGYAFFYTAFVDSRRYCRGLP